jgi:predicted amidophosphoribosyltransferase
MILKSTMAADPFDLWSPASIYQYHPYWTDRSSRIRNPAFDQYSRHLLNLKNPAHFGYAGALVALSTGLKAALPQHIDLTKSYEVAVIPGHEKDSHGQGLLSVVAIVCHDFARLNNKGRLLNRHTTIDKRTDGGDRSQSVHFSSVRIAPGESVVGKRVLLLDDVTTSENSMCACRQILLNSGAIDVVGIAHGRTTRGAPQRLITITTFG